MAFASGPVVTDTANLADSAVTTAKVNDDAITLAKIAAGTDGELITWDASGDPAAVTTGTSGQILTSNGAGAAPTFQTAATVDLTDIGTSVISDTDNTDDLGTASIGWKNLYLSGGAYIGGLAADNNLAIVDRGTFTPAAYVGATDNSGGVGVEYGTWFRWDDMVFINGRAHYQDTVSGTGSLAIKNLPFTSYTGQNQAISVYVNDYINALGIAAKVAASSTIIDFYRLPQTTSAGLVSMNQGDLHPLNGGKYAYFSGCYRIA